MNIIHFWLFWVVMVGVIVAILALVYFAGKFHKVPPIIDTKYKQHPKLDVLWTLVPVVI